MAPLRLLGRSFVRSERAAAMVEFAVVVPLLILLAFGTIDYGRVYYVFNALSSIARDGARYGAAQDAPTVAAIKSRVRTVIAPQYLRAGAPVPTDAQLAVTVTATDVIVTVQNYPFDAWGPVLPVAKGLNLSSSARFRREWP